MRPHGYARISARTPEAVGICDRCGFMWQLNQLRYQWDWLQGPRLFNLRIRVCPDCIDIPQESGRTIVLPPDPVPVADPRPENYAAADNPVSYLGYNPADAFLPLPSQTLGGNIGNMTLHAGVDAAFNSITNKRASMCAGLAISNSSFQNWVGKNWSADPSGTSITLPSTFGPVTHVLSSYTLYAPNDAPFLNSATGVTGYTVDGSVNGATWTTLSSGATAGGVGETITANTTSGAFYQYHRAVIQGDGISAVAIAQAIFNISDQAANDI